MKVKVSEVKYAKGEAKKGEQKISEYRAGRRETERRGERKGTRRVRSVGEGDGQVPAGGIERELLKNLLHIISDGRVPLHHASSASPRARTHIHTLGQSVP